MVFASRLRALLLVALVSFATVAAREYSYEWEDTTMIEIDLISSFGFAAAGEFSFSAPYTPTASLNTLVGVLTLCPSGNIEEVVDFYNDIKRDRCEHIPTLFSDCTSWNISFPSTSSTLTAKLPMEREGPQSLIYFGCPTTAPMKFGLYYSFINPGPTFLPVGWEPVLPLSTYLVTAWALILLGYSSVICFKKSCKKKRLRVLHWAVLINASLFFVATFITYLTARLGVQDESWVTPNRTIFPYIISSAAIVVLICTVLGVIATWGNFIHKLTPRRLRVGIILFFVCYSVFLLSFLDVALWGIAGALLKLASGLVLVVIGFLAFLALNHSRKPLAAVITAATVSIKASVGSPQILHMYKIARCYQYFLLSLVVSLLLLLFTALVFIALYQLEFVLMKEWIRLLILHVGSFIAMLECLYALVCRHRQITQAVSLEQRFRSFQLAGVTLSRSGLLNVVGMRMGEMASVEGFQYGDNLTLELESEDALLKVMRAAATAHEASHPRARATFVEPPVAVEGDVLDSLGRLDAEEVNASQFGQPMHVNPAGRPGTTNSPHLPGVYEVLSPAPTPSPNGLVDAWRSASTASTDSETRRKRAEWEERPAGGEKGQSFSASSHEDDGAGGDVGITGGHHSPHSASQGSGQDDEDDRGGSPQLPNDIAANLGP